jgi:hypothetical protein
MKGNGLAAALALAAIAIGGCGGDGGDGGSDASGGDDGSAAVAASTPKAVKDAATDSPSKAEVGAKKKEAEKDAAPAKEGGDADRPTRAEREKALEELRSDPASAIENASAKQKARLIKQAAYGATRLLGLKLASVSSSEDGTSALLRITRGSACIARPEDDGEIVDYMKKGVPTLETVRVEVAGTSQTLASYTRANCKVPTFPEGEGKIVFVQSGPGTRQGLVKTKFFKVTQKKWVIEYDNRANYLSVFIERPNGDNAPDYAATTRPGIGRSIITLPPGRYRLSISGASWTVRVRDGV